MRRTPDQEARYEPATRKLAARLAVMFGLRECRYESFPFDDQLPRIEPGGIVLPGAEPGVAPWELDNGVELPVRTDGLTLGRFVLVPRSRTCGVALSPGGRATAITLAKRLAPLIAGAIQADERAGREA